jgi:hypothetical protein
MRRNDRGLPRMPSGFPSEKVDNYASNEWIDAQL